MCASSMLTFDKGLSYRVVFKKDWCLKSCYQGRRKWKWRVRGQGGGQERPDWKVVRNDMEGLGLASVDTLGSHAWRRKIVGGTCWSRFAWNSPGILSRLSRPLNGVCGLTYIKYRSLKFGIWYLKYNIICFFLIKKYIGNLTLVTQIQTQPIRPWTSCQQVVVTMTASLYAWII